MPSPFPGMNPYLERASVWHDFHDVFAMECRRALLPQIRPAFIATLDDNVYIHELSAEERRLLGRGDVSVVEREEEMDTEAGGVALAAPVTGRRFGDIEALQAETFAWSTDANDTDPSSTGTTTLIEDPPDLAAALLAPFKVEVVNVNGSPVQALDVSRVFFTPVTLVSGPNLFTVEAINGLGNAITRDITLIGVDPGGAQDISTFDDLTLLTALSYAQTTFNRSTQILHSAVTLTNDGAEELEAPTVAVFEAITPAAVTLANADGTHPTTGAAYVSFDDEFTGGVLAPGATSGSIPLAFANDGRWRFNLTTAILTPPNDAPFFTSTPGRRGHLPHRHHRLSHRRQPRLLRNRLRPLRHPAMDHVLQFDE